MGFPKDLTNVKFGKLTAVKILGKTKDCHMLWFCKCECGGTKNVASNVLRRGDVQSCGCIKNKHKITHNLSRNKIYGVWHCMISRCENKNDKSYKHYGYRGIKVCDEWHDITTFYEWAIKNNYQKGLMIERIDNDSDYKPSNCKFSDYLEQANNKRSNLIIFYDGEYYTLANICRKLDLKYSTVRDRIKRYGYSELEALTKPTKQSGGKTNGV